MLQEVPLGTACSGRWAQCNPPVAPALLRVLPSVGPQSRRSGLGATFILVLIYLSKFTPQGARQPDHGPGVRHQGPAARHGLGGVTGGGGDGGEEEDLLT